MSLFHVIMNFYKNHFIIFFFFNDAPRGKGFNKIFLCHFKWPSNDMARCLEGPKVPRSFSFRIVFFLVITALFCFFI